MTSDATLETRLLKRVARGDRMAFALLYDRLEPLAFGLALRVCGDPRVAQDALQEAFLRVWTRARSFDKGRGSARAWVLRIVRNATLDHLRAEQAHERAKLRAQQSEALPSHAAPERPDLQLVRAEQSSSVRTALDELPDEQRRLIEIAYFQGLSHSEIARQEGMPLGTVKARIFHGMGRLREIAAEGKSHG